MGITLIAPPAASNGSVANIGTTDSALPLSTDGLAFDFAALLSGQITALQLGAATTPLGSSLKPVDKDIPEIISDLLPPQDPALNPQMALAYTVPTLANSAQHTEDTAPKVDLTQLAGLNLLPSPEKSLATGTEKGQEKAINSGKETSPFLLGDPKIPSSPILSTTSADQPATTPAIAANATEAAILAGEHSSSGNIAPPTFASSLAASNAARAHPNASANLPPVSTPLQDSRWPQDFGDRVVWMAKNDQQQAQINITPPQMGPIQITLSMNGDQASIAFVSPHAEVRKAIEDALPNLREMLSTSGISLGQSDVGAELKQQQRDLAGQFANGQRSTGETAILPADSRLGSRSSGQLMQQGRGLVDLFA